MKYDLKDIMKKAWEIKKDNTKNIFSECLKISWALAKKGANKVIDTIKNLVLNTYSSFNQRRYSDPWVAEVINGSISFKNKIGEYTGGYRTGNEGELVLYLPDTSKVYAYGQKDNRGGNTAIKYIQFDGVGFVEITKLDALNATN